jgi:hypothetical protein
MRGTFVCIKILAREDDSREGYHVHPERKAHVSRDGWSYQLPRMWNNILRSPHMYNDLRH